MPLYELPFPSASGQHGLRGPNLLGGYSRHSRDARLSRFLADRPRGTGCLRRAQDGAIDGSVSEGMAAAIHRAFNHRAAAQESNGNGPSEPMGSGGQHLC
jgi:hypothetical protein